MCPCGVPGCTGTAPAEVDSLDRAPVYVQVSSPAERDLLDGIRAVRASGPVPAQRVAGAAS